MARATVIAIDGPSASGKSTVGQLLARRLRAAYFDTGLLYRAATWMALREGISADKGEELARLIGSGDISIGPPEVEDGRQFDVYVGGIDISEAIRTPEIDRTVSAYSANHRLRQALIPLQRNLAGGSGLVIVAGRDIGSVIFPEAALKVYLEAGLPERARRRTRQAGGQGLATDYDSVLRDMRTRDELDSTRQVAPSRPAPDAVVIDTTEFSPDQVVDKIMELLRIKGLGDP